MRYLNFQKRSTADGLCGNNGITRETVDSSSAVNRLGRYRPVSTDCFLYIGGHFSFGHLDFS